MATRIVYFSVFDLRGYALSGLALNFNNPGYYRINGSSATAPTISEVGSTGTYSFTATLNPGENLAWRVSLGATSSSRYAFGDMVYADCLVPSVASDLPTPAAVASAVLDEQVSPHSGVGSLGAAVQTLLLGVSSIQSKTAALPTNPATEATASAAKVAAELAARLLKNKIAWDVNTAVMTVYDDTGTGTLLRFVFTDENGLPSITSALNRNPL